MVDSPSSMTLRVAIFVIVTLSVAPSARALTVGGGGSPKTDCLTVFDADANYPLSKPKSIRCTDGDPCDADHEVNGSCQFQVAVCANYAGDDRCTLVGVDSIVVDHALDNGDRRFDPEFQALQTRIDSKIDPPSSSANCTVPTNLHVPVLGPFANNACKRGRKDIRITTRSTPIAGKIYKDRDKFQLTCEPALTGCDPGSFYAGTFDRIQRQIFNQSCAVSGCHDSQSKQANLLLETGAARSNLINVTPYNPAAAAAGWMRVTVTDPDV